MRWREAYWRIASWRPEGPDGVLSPRARAWVGGHRGTVLLAAFVAIFVLSETLPAHLRARRLRAREQALTAQAATLVRDCDRLAAAAGALGSDPVVVEEAIRERLGLVRKGEVVLGR